MSTAPSPSVASPIRVPAGTTAQDALKAAGVPLKGADGAAIDAMAAGDLYLNFEQAAKAEEMYELALTRSGVDTGRALTRLGIAQVDQGQFAAAQATFAKVQGVRAPIAELWGLYAAAQASGGATAAPAAPAADPAAPAEAPAR